MTSSYAEVLGTSSAGPSGLVAGGRGFGGFSTGGGLGGNGLFGLT